MTGEIYTSTFGGNNVNPANLSYVAYTISTNVALTWAFEAVNTDNVTADKIDINCGTPNLTVAMPSANQVSVGQDVLFGGVGTQPFVVTDNGGNVICTVASGLEWYVFLTDNSTVDGIWRAVQFGASTSAANAAALAGAGLRANVTRLDQNLVTNALLSDYAFTAADRALVTQNGGGSVVYTFADAGVVGNGWFVYVINAGSGNITLTPTGGQTIDGSATKVIAPTESLIVFSDGSNYHSLGYGRSIVNTVTGAAINAAGSGTLTLNATQVAAQVQDFSGTLTGNKRIEYGAGIGYWFVFNNTTGAFTLTMAVNGLDAGVTVPQGAFSILRSNGTNMEVAFSGAVGTVTSVATTANLIGGPITTTGTLDLSDTTVTPGAYGSVGPPILVPVLTIDQKGRITNATTIMAGTAASGTTGTAPGNIPVLDAGGNIPSLNGGFQPGDVVMSIALTKPGWVFANGTTIGSAASAATQRANADTINLYTVLYNSCANAQAPVSGGRGANAAADFAANKTITVLDLRGTVIGGMDVINGSVSAGRLSGSMASTTMGAALSVASLNSTATSVSFSSSGTNNINFGAVSVHTNIDSASLGLASPGGVVFAATGGDSTDGATAAINGNFGISVSGGGSFGSSAFNIAQSTMVMNPFLKL